MEPVVGNTILNELIQDYLSFHSFKNTHDCFKAELQARRVSSKLINSKSGPSTTQKANEPRLYEFLKPEGAKTIRENQLEAEMTAIGTSYKRLMLASKAVLSVSVGMVQYLEANSEKIEGSRDKIEEFKQNLTRFHGILIGKRDGNTVLSAEEIRELKERLVKGVKNKENEVVVKGLVDFRLRMLKTKPEERFKGINLAVEGDLLGLKVEENKENTDIFNTMGEINDHRLQTGLMAVISMFVACREGTHYLSKGFTDNGVFIRALKILKEEKENTTLKRFCVAIVEKVSVFEEVMPVLVENEAVSWVLVRVNSRDPKEEFSCFLANYYTAFLLNACLWINNQARNIKEIIPGGAEFVLTLSLKLLSDPTLSFLSLSNALLLASMFFNIRHLKELESLNFPQKLKIAVSELKVPSNQKTVLEELTKRLFSASSQEENLELVLTQRSEAMKEAFLSEIRGKKEEESIIFEAFADESY